MNRKNIDVKLDNCTFIKTILMILVVVYHSVLFWSGNWFSELPVFASNVLPVLAKWLNTIHIYGFTLVSGYIFYHIKMERGGYDKFLPFIKKKAARLLIPYAFVAMIWVIPIAVYYFKYDFNDIFFKFILATSPSQLWFLVMLFNVFVISYLMSKIWEKHSGIGFIIVVGFYGLGIVASQILPNVFMIWTSCQYVLFFWIGFCLRKYKEGIVWKIPISIYLIADVILFVFVQYVSKKEQLLFKLLNMAGNTLLSIIGAIMIFLLLQKLADSINWKNKYFAFISDKSMVVYLFHQQMIYFTISLLNGLINPWLHAGINFVFSFGLSLIFAMILKKFKVTRILIGEK